jgi:hypothetical protein
MIASPIIATPVSARPVAAGAIAASGALPASLQHSGSGKSWLWKSGAGSTVAQNSLWTHVPVGGGYYATYIFVITDTNYWLSGLSLGCIGSYKNHNAVSGVTKVGTWTTRALNYSPEGTSCDSSTAGNTCEFAVTGHTLTMRTFGTTNGGFMIVGVDGDYTGAANRLPKFTADDFTAGLCRAGDVGKTYIDTYDNSISADVHVVIADGLTDAAHTVTCEATGTKRAASSAARAYIGGIVACSSSDVGQDLQAAVRVIANVEPVCLLNRKGGSAMMFVPEVKKALTNVYEFLGENHGAETIVSRTITVDGADQSAIAANGYAGGSVVEIVEISTLASTDATGTPVCQKYMTHRATAQQQSPMTVTWYADWLVEKQVQNYYPCMLPVGVSLPATAINQNTRWNAGTFGSYTSIPSNWTTNNDTNHGKVPATLAQISSSLHPRRAYMAMLDGVNSVAGFRNSSPDYVFLRDRTDGLDKIYVSRSTATNPETFAVGQRVGGAVGFGVLPS